LFGSGCQVLRVTVRAIASGRAAASSAANRPTTFQVIKTRHASANGSPGITKAACPLGNLLHSFLTTLPRTLQPLGKAPNYCPWGEKAPSDVTVLYAGNKVVYLPMELDKYQKLV
jgi:hypothetical protein